MTISLDVDPKEATKISGVVHIDGTARPQIITEKTDKFYYHHTGFPGGIKSVALGKMREKSPEKILENAVKGMMPRNRLGRAMLSKLKVYAGDSHPHSAQQPRVLEL